MTVPETVRQATFPVRVDAQPLAEGVVLLGGAEHHRLALAVTEFRARGAATIDEARSLAVIEGVAGRMPGKPIRFLVNTHQHFDHIGGLRTYLHIGATIITHAKNYDFYQHPRLHHTPAHGRPRT